MCNRHNRNKEKLIRRERIKWRKICNGDKEKIKERGRNALTLEGKERKKMGE